MKEKKQQYKKNIDKNKINLTVLQIVLIIIYYNRQMNIDITLRR